MSLESLDCFVSSIFYFYAFSYSVFVTMLFQVIKG
jgi:hypothetical protein